jgi:segregation and condensation protein A
MSYTVKLELFEGPLDLLLHLIKKNEMSITDIPIATITDQYLAYMELLEEMNLDVAGEFLVMAATLMYIKSRLLLPEPESPEDEEDEDPRAELVQQLLEYQRFRDAAFELGRREVLTRDVFARPPGEPPADVVGEVTYRDVSLGELLDALRAVLRRLAVRTVHEVQPEGLSIRDCITPILAQLRESAEKQVRFEALFPEDCTRHRLIVTFLALLELMRLGVVRARQESRFGEIVITLAAATIEAAEALARSLYEGDADDVAVSRGAGG